MVEATENEIETALMDLLKTDAARNKETGRARFTEGESRLLRLAAYTICLQDARIKASEDEITKLEKAASDAS